MTSWNEFSRSAYVKEVKVTGGRMHGSVRVHSNVCCAYSALIRKVVILILIDTMHYIRGQGVNNVHLLQVLFHPGEVNKIRELPQASNIVITHTDDAKLYVWNLDKQPARQRQQDDVSRRLEPRGEVNKIPPRRLLGLGSFN